jgi:hypothetical protein
MSVGFALPASKGSAHSDPTTTSVSPRLSPEETVDAYLQALATRDFRTAKRLKPALDPEKEGWLEKPSPIAHISLLSAKPIPTGSSRTTVRAHIHYCREDGTGTDETKSYALAVNASGAWEIRMEEHLPPTPTDIRC